MATYNQLPPQPPPNAPFDALAWQEWFRAFRQGFNVVVTNALTPEEVQAIYASLNTINNNINTINNNLSFYSSKQLVTPTTGSTVTWNNSIQTLILSPTTSLAALTINLPTTPTDGMSIKGLSTKSISSVTWVGGGKTIIGAPTSIALSLSGNSFNFIYNSSNTTWYYYQ